MGKKKTDSIIIATVASAILMTIGIIIRVICLLNREREREREHLKTANFLLEFGWRVCGSKFNSS